MKVYILCFVLSAIAIVECGHMFVGTNVGRPLMFYKNLPYDSKFMQKRIEFFNYTLPYTNTIKGILAYDLTNSGASANITVGGTGYNFVNIRMKSDRGKKLNYDIYVYA